MVVQYADRVYKVLDVANMIARHNGDSLLSIEHFLLASVLEGRCEARWALDMVYGIKAEELNEFLRDKISLAIEPNYDDFLKTGKPRSYKIIFPEIPEDAPLEFGYDDEMLKVFEDVEMYVETRGRNIITTKDLLLSIVKISTSRDKKDDIARKLFGSVDYQRLEDYIEG